MHITTIKVNSFAELKPKYFGLQYATDTFEIIAYAQDNSHVSVRHTRKLFVSGWKESQVQDLGTEGWTKEMWNNKLIQGMLKFHDTRKEVS